MPISCGLVYGVGDPAAVAPLREAFAGGLPGSLFGEPEEVAAQFPGFADLGIDRLTLMPFVADSHARIAPFLRS